jgi:uncharacterized protein YjiS (DUF1127 family)
MAVIMASHGATAIGRAVHTPSLLARLFAWHAHWLQNRRMQALDAHLRRDIGLDNRSAGRAAARPGWDVSLPGLR